MAEQGETYFYEPGKGHGLPHDPFKAIVAPRHLRGARAKITLQQRARERVPLVVVHPRGLQQRFHFSSAERNSDATRPTS